MDEVDEKRGGGWRDVNMKKMCEEDYVCRDGI